MNRLRTSHLLLGALSLVGCSAAPTSSSVGADPVAETSQAIVNGTNDVYASPAAEAAADVVVSLDMATTSGGVDCSGMLIAPRVVITARHCIRGSVANGENYTTNSIAVHVGSSHDNPTASVAATQWIPTFDAPTGTQDADTATDFALVLLPASPQITAGLPIQRPSFSVAAPTLDFAAGFAPAEGGANDTRQIGEFVFLSGFPLPGVTATGTSSVLKAYGPDATDHGDSGGPLFFYRPDGTRDLRGITSGWYKPFLSSTQYQWADTSSVYARNWIATQAQDTSRSPKWLASHGVTAGNYWLGEADLAGPCRIDLDADCDDWNNEHDNCPDVANTDQADSNDNGYGDACDGAVPILPLPPPPPPSFALSASAVSVPAGRIDGIDVFTSGTVGISIALGQSGVPAQWYPTFSSKAVSDGGDSMLSFQVPSTVPAGTVVNATISGTSGSVSHTLDRAHHRDRVYPYHVRGPR